MGPWSCFFVDNTAVSQSSHRGSHRRGPGLPCPAVDARPRPDSGPGIPAREPGNPLWEGIIMSGNEQPGGATVVSVPLAKESAAGRVVTPPGTQLKSAFPARG